MTALALSQLLKILFVGFVELKVFVFTDGRFELIHMHTRVYSHVRTHFDINPLGLISTSSEVPEPRRQDCLCVSQSFPALPTSSPAAPPSLGGGGALGSTLQSPGGQALVCSQTLNF